MISIVTSRVESLKSGFRDEKRAKKGFNLLLRLTKNNDDKLEQLLRNNKSDGVYDDDEIYDRDNVDFALAFISILAVAFRINYIPQKDINQIFEQEIKLLDNKYIKRYYTDYYPLPLIVWFTENKQILNNTGRLCSVLTAKYFEQFMYLLRNRMDDMFIDQFLWLLDDGETYDEENDKYLDIDFFWKTINQVNEGNEKNLTDLFKKAFIGMTNFIEYIEQIKSLLNSCKNNRILSSLIWSFESYWFVNLKNEIDSNIINRVKEYYFKLRNENSKVRVSESELNKTIRSIQFLLNYENRNAYKII